MCPDVENLSLFLPEDLPDLIEPEPKIKQLNRAIWTEHKAKLIERYLLYFVYITKHGTYIDGFAGPQKPDHPEMWAANLVLANEPRWLRHFHLFDVSPTKVQQLVTLRDKQPKVDSNGKKFKRDIQIYQGDFNSRIGELLDKRSISDKEATFCLLDQRTFECQWETVKRLANYKSKGNNKIELFYFLAIGWLGRALSGQKDMETLEAWWGRDDYLDFCRMSNADRVIAVTNRFKQELGYKSTKPWPIYEKLHGKGQVMYYMIHATDHPEAPGLMRRAYERAVKPKETHDQLLLELKEQASFSNR
jgi:three-Cys-motif partner protein